MAGSIVYGCAAAAHEAWNTVGCKALHLPNLLPSDCRGANQEQGNTALQPCQKDCRSVKRPAQHHGRRREELADYGPGIEQWRLSDNVPVRQVYNRGIDIDVTNNSHHCVLSTRLVSTQSLERDAMLQVYHSDTGQSGKTQQAAQQHCHNWLPLASYSHLRIFMKLDDMSHNVQDILIPCVPCYSSSADWYYVEGVQHRTCPRGHANLYGQWHIARQKLPVQTSCEASVVQQMCAWQIAFARWPAMMSI